MATKREGGVFLDGLLSLVMLLVLAGSIWYQGESLRTEMREMRTEIADLRTEMRTEIGDLRESVGELETAVAGLAVSVTNLEVAVAGLAVSVAKLEVAVARIDARRSLRLMLAERFVASGEGASYGGPSIAASLLVALALPEIDAALSTIDQDARTELAEELWEDRVNILARASPVL